VESLGAGDRPWPPPARVSASMGAAALAADDLGAPLTNEAAPSGLGSLAQLGVRTVGTLAILSLGVAVSLGAYHRFAWVRGERPHAAPLSAAAHAPSPTLATTTPPARGADARAARLRAVVARGEALTGGDLSPAHVAELRTALAALRAEGAMAEADRLAGAAADALERQAEAALDRGDVDGGVALLRLGASLGGAPARPDRMVRVLLGRGRRALGRQRVPEALHLGQQAVAIAAADADARGFYADALYASHDFASAAAEYARALAARPDDVALQQALARSRAHVAAGDRRRTSAATPKRVAAARAPQPTPGSAAMAAPPPSDPAAAAPPPPEPSAAPAPEEPKAHAAPDEPEAPPHAAPAPPEPEPAPAPSPGE
jgi:hypothetical protein